MNYLVLRNYENMLSPKLFVGSHADVDLLCEKSKDIVKILNAIPTRKDYDEILGDGIHYSLIIGDERVSFDLRQVGDGYYCDKWEKDLLRRKKRHNCFYVMDDEDYFYTLIYHAILQKRHFSNEYKLRLSQMADSLQIQMNRYDEGCFISVLENYMRLNDYRFVYSNDILVPNRFHLVNASLIDSNRNLKLKHLLFDAKVSLIETLVSIKHALNL